MLTIFTSGIGYDIFEICRPRKYLDQGYNNDVIFLYIIQKRWIDKSVQQLVILYKMSDSSIMDIIDKLIQRVQKTQHGFSDTQKTADEVFAGHTARESLKLAKKLFVSEMYQARSLATFILGRLASNSNESLLFLKARVSKDNDWRVQEILAKAFDSFCRDVGYANALAVIKEWLADSNPNVRRAVTEGLRIWTARPYFREHPEVAIQLLSQFRDDQSEYVRKSVGNALRDISKKHMELVKSELCTWDIENKQVKQTHKLASKFLLQTRG